MVKYWGDEEVNKNRCVMDRWWEHSTIKKSVGRQWYEDKGGLGSGDRGVKEGPDQQDHNDHVG
jgi:hypothetical protein